MKGIILKLEVEQIIIKRVGTNHGWVSFFFTVFGVDFYGALLGSSISKLVYSNGFGAFVVGYTLYDFRAVNKDI